MNTKKRAGMAMSIALAAGIIGTLATIIQTKGCKGRLSGLQNSAKEMFGSIKRVSSNGEGPGRNFFTAGVAGGIIGIATALLLAPKAGKDLLAGVVKSARSVSDRTINRLNSVVATVKKTQKPKRKVVRSTIPAKRVGIKTKTRTNPVRKKKSE